MRKLIIDSRMRDTEKEYLKKFGELIEIKKQICTYEEISSHPDIFICKVKDMIVVAPNLNIDNSHINNIILGENNIKKDYPNDIMYNVCILGNYAIHNFNYTDKKILELIEKNNIKKIHVEQGYSNCSICQVSDDACITQDEGVYKRLKDNNIDVLKIEKEEICLLNNGISKMKGFIGGATFLIDNKLILFGDKNKLLNKDMIEEFLKKYNVELIGFENLDIVDYGGVTIIN